MEAGNSVASPVLVARESGFAAPATGGTMRITGAPAACGRESGNANPRTAGKVAPGPRLVIAVIGKYSAR